MAPTSGHVYGQLTKGVGPARSPTQRPYPSTYGVFRYFQSFRQAWEAAGVPVDRSFEPWSEIEDWYLREGIGLISRKAMAADLNRTPDAVHRRLCDLGLHAYQTLKLGWTLHRFERIAGIQRSDLDKYLERGDVPYRRGSKCIYVDPADLLIAGEIDWQNPPAEIERDVRRSIAERLVKILRGEDWRLGRPYQVQRIRRTQRVYKWRDVPSGLPPEHVAVGDRVRCVGRIPQKEFILGRVGIVHLIYFRRQGLGGPHWMARVEFKRERQREGWAPRLIYGLPVETVEREK